MKLLAALLFSCIFLSPSFSATIQGYIYDKETSEPLFGCNVLLWGTKKGAATDVKGYFKIEDVQLGKHTLHISYIGYAMQIDSVFIESPNQVVDLVFQMDVCFVPIDTVSEIEDYHRYLSKYEAGDVLKIIIDSLSRKGDRLTAHSTFYNRADTPIYVIRDYEMVKMVRPIVESSYGVRIARNSMYIDFVGEKENPDESDFFKIPAHSSIKYNVLISLYGFAGYPVDIYEIKLNYNYKRRSRLAGICQDPEFSAKHNKGAFYFYNMAFRGDVISSNYLLFNNEEVVKERLNK